MVPLRYELYLEDLTRLVETGEIPMSRIDDAVERILRVKFVAGLFEHPLSDKSLIDFVGCKVNSWRSLTHLGSNSFISDTMVNFYSLVIRLYFCPPNKPAIFEQALV